MPGQQLQQVELGAGEFELLPGAPGPPGGRLDPQVRDGQDLGGGGGRVAAQQGAQPGEQLLHVEGLDQVVVGAGVQAGDPVRDLHPGGEHQHRGAVAGLAQPAADLQPVRLRHHHVEHQDVRALLGEDGQGLGTVRGDAHPVALQHQRAAERFADGPVVLGDQHGVGHGDDSPWRAHGGYRRGRRTAGRARTAALSPAAPWAYGGHTGRTAATRCRGRRAGRPVRVGTSCRRPRWQTGWPSSPPRARSGRGGTRGSGWRTGGRCTGPASCCRWWAGRRSGAWTAGCRSATAPARWGTSCPSGTGWWRPRTGGPRRTGCWRPTTSRSSPGGSARRPARAPACWPSTAPRWPSRTWSWPSPTGPGPRAGTVRGGRSRAAVGGVVVGRVAGAGVATAGVAVGRVAVGGSR